MKGLLRNNFYSAQSTMAISSIVALCFGVFSLLMPSLLGMAIAITVFVFPGNITSSLQTDETSKWNKFELTAPVTRKTIVRAKYLGYIIVLGIGIVCCAPVLGLSLLLGNVEPGAMLYWLGYGIAMTLLAGGLMYPLMFRFGADKGEIWLIISAMVSAGVLVVFFVVLNVLSGGVLDGFIAEKGLLAVLMAGVAFFLSYCLSVRIHARKEF